MTQEELYRIYEEISDFIYNNNWRGYHIWYICGSVNVISNSTIEFEVYGSSDQGDGDEWIEHWDSGKGVDGKTDKLSQFNNIDEKIIARLSFYNN